MIDTRVLVELEVRQIFLAHVDHGGRRGAHAQAALRAKLGMLKRGSETARTAVMLTVTVVKYDKMARCRQLLVSKPRREADVLGACYRAINYLCMLRTADSGELPRCPKVKNVIAAPGQDTGTTAAPPSHITS